MCTLEKFRSLVKSLDKYRSEKQEHPKVIDNIFTALDNALEQILPDRKKPTHFHDDSQDLIDSRNRHSTVVAIRVMKDETLSKLIGSDEVKQKFSTLLSSATPFSTLGLSIRDVYPTLPAVSDTTATKAKGMFVSFDQQITTTTEVTDTNPKTAVDLHNSF